MKNFRKILLNIINIINIYKETKIRKLDLYYELFLFSYSFFLYISIFIISCTIFFRSRF